MKKLFSLLLAALMAVSMLAMGEAQPKVNVSALIGPTGMGLVKLMKDNEETQKYAVTLTASADMITPDLLTGKTDIAYVPANLASVLYQKTNGEVRALAVNTLGILYIVERADRVKTISDLRGRTLYASGKGATPEYALNYLLTENDLNPETDLTIVYMSDHTECLTALLQNPDAVAMLPQPFVTAAQAKAQDMRVALDMSALWDALQATSEAPSAMVTGVVVARADFIRQYPEKVQTFLEEYAASVAYVNESVDEAAKLIGEYGIVAENVARLAIPKCNIVCVTGEAMKTMLSGYLNVLYQQNPTAVGGQVPDDAFYCGA